MTNNEKNQLRILLIKYQLIYFVIVLCLSLVIVFGYSKIQYLLAENLFKTNMNQLLVHDFRTVILNMDQFVPSQFSTIELIKNGQVILSIGSQKNHFLNFKTEFITKDEMSLVFSSSYRLIIALVSLVLVFSLMISRFINKYFTRTYEKQMADQAKLQRSELLNEISKKVAHDIRSPLSTLNMLASLIENSEVREMQQAVTKQIDHIANDLLNYSKNHNSKAHGTPASLKDLFLQLKKEYDLKMLSMKCSIVFEDQLDSDISLSDLTVLYQNINNFINNSVEANAKFIKVVMGADKSVISIAVIDDGIGMDEEGLKRIGKSAFSTKNQSDALASLVSSGNGIAMLNALKAFEIRGWRLDIKSNVGIGTTVSVLIPKIAI